MFPALACQPLCLVPVCLVLLAVVKANNGGAGDGTVQSFSFILRAPNVNLDAPSLLSNTDWFVRSQSTSPDSTPTGGQSAKTTGAIGVIPACE